MKFLANIANAKMLVKANLITLLITAVFYFIAFSAAYSEDIQYNSFTISKTDGTEAMLELQIAKTINDRAIGLMHRDHLDDFHGMIFIFDDPVIAKFWMKNTLIPLDIIMLDEQGIISSIHYNAKPNSLEHISAIEPILYTIEIKAGEADLLGLKIGDKLLLRQDLLRN